MADLIGGERYEFSYGNSNKFWCWRLYERQACWELRFAWGRIGTDGQEMVETFTDKRLALWKAGIRAENKRAKGYRLANSTEGLVSSMRQSIDAAKAAKARDEPQPIVTARRVRLRD